MRKTTNSKGGKERKTTNSKGGIERKTKKEKYRKRNRDSQVNY